MAPDTILVFPLLLLTTIEHVIFKIISYPQLRFFQTRTLRHNLVLTYLSTTDTDVNTLIPAGLLKRKRDWGDMLQSLYANQAKAEPLDCLLNGGQLARNPVDVGGGLHLLEVTGVADSGNLFILGRSMSGVVSSIFAARQPNDFAGLLLYYPAFNMPGTSDKYKAIDEIPEKSLAMDNRRVVGKAFYVDMFGMDPFETVHAYDGDVLIVYGDQDTTVPFEWSERAVKEYAHAELVKVPGARHGFQGEHQKIALAAVEDYVWKHFNA